MSGLSKYFWPLMVLAILGLVGCGGATPTKDPSMAYTQIWLTVAAAQTQTGTYISATPLATNSPSISTTPRPTHTPLLTATLPPGAPTATSSAPNATLVPTSTTSASAITQNSACDNANFVKDVTIPDGTEVVAGSTFVKTWSFKNLGPCTWTPNYHLVFSYVSDTGKNGVFSPPSAVSFPNNVLPGEEVELSVTLTAPTKAATYQVIFVLQNDKGYSIPLVNEKTYEFYVLFVVK